MCTADDDGRRDDRPNRPQEPLSPRWALIFLFAFVVATVFGGLTYAQFGAAAGVLAALSAFGATVVGLHGLLP